MRPRHREGAKDRPWLKALQIANCRLRIDCKTPGPRHHLVRASSAPRLYPSAICNCRPKRVTALIRFAALITSVTLLGTPAHSQLPVEPTDPLPIRRVALAPDRVPLEMEQVRQGVLVQISQDEFEALVRKASLAGEAAKKPARLVESRYRGRLEEESLVGSGEWKIINPAPEGYSGSVVLLLQPLSLAVQ